MGVHSGKFGAVDSVTTVRNWGIEQISASQPFVASNTKGGTGRRRGVKDWSGQYSCYGHTPPAMPGEFFDFEGYTAPDNDTWGANGLTYYGNAIVDSIALTLNFESSELFNFQTSFSGNGALARKSDVVSDATDPEAHTPLDARVLILDPGGDVLGSDSGSASGGEEFCVTNLNFTITSATQTSVTSCTNGWTERHGGPIDMTGSMTVQDIDPSSFGLEIWDDVIIRIYVDGTDFWELKWVHIKDFTGLTVDRETGAIMSMGISFEMNGFLENYGTGRILLPGAGSNWWPPAGA